MHAFRTQVMKFSENAKKIKWKNGKKKFSEKELCVIFMLEYDGIIILYKFKNFIKILYLIYLFI